MLVVPMTFTPSGDSMMANWVFSSGLVCWVRALRTVCGSIVLQVSTALLVVSVPHLSQRVLCTVVRVWQIGQ